MPILDACRSAVRAEDRARWVDRLGFRAADNDGSSARRDFTSAVPAVARAKRRGSTVTDCQAHFTCPECGGVIDLAAVEPSFTIWAAYAGFESWERIARADLAARGDPAAEPTWWNDTAGRA